MLISTLLMFTLVGPSRAGFIVNLTETGGNVVATGSGTLNITALALDSGGGNFSPVLVPNGGEALFGLPHSDIDLYDTPVGPASFGSGGPFAADSGTGDFVGILPISSSPNIDLLAVPRNYVSGSMLQSSATWSGSTFASLGLTPGTYTWTWGTGADADFFTINIGAVLGARTVVATAGLWRPGDRRPRGPGPPPPATRRRKGSPTVKEGRGAITGTWGNYVTSWGNTQRGQQSSAGGTATVNLPVMFARSAFGHYPVRLAAVTDGTSNAVGFSARGTHSPISRVCPEVIIAAIRRARPTRSRMEVTPWPPKSKVP